MDDVGARSGTSPESRLLNAIQRALESGQPPMPLDDADTSERLPPLTTRILGILQRDNAADPVPDEPPPAEALILPKDEWPEFRGVQPVAEQSEDDRSAMATRPTPSPFLPALRSSAIAIVLTAAGFAIGMFLSGQPSRYTSRITISAQNGVVKR